MGDAAKLLFPISLLSVASSVPPHMNPFPFTSQSHWAKHAERGKALSVRHEIYVFTNLKAQHEGIYSAQKSLFFVRDFLWP